MRYMKLENITVPDSLSGDETIELIYELIHGSQEAREKLVTHNMNLVIFVINKYFNNTCYDFDDLFSVGMIGLIKAIDTYDALKNFELSSYASRCISNEIYMFIRRQAKYKGVDSFDRVVFTSDRDRDISLGDCLESDLNVEEDYLKLEFSNAILDIINGLKYEDAELIKLYFGFYGKRYEQTKLATIFNLTQSQISRKIKKLVDIIGYELNKQQLLDDKRIRKGKRINFIK